MAHGLNPVLKRGSVGCKSEGKTGIGSRRIFAPHFKLQVLDSYRNDSDCKGNQRATARKYGIHRRQIQKWLQVESNLRNSVGKCKSDGGNSENPEARKCEVALTSHRQLDDSTLNVVAAVTPDPYAYSESRVPCISPGSFDDNSSRVHGKVTPLDFSTHSRGHGSPIVANQEAPLMPVDPAAPIDLSLKKVAIAPTAALTAPVPMPPLTPPKQRESPHSLSQPHPDVWDLSTKNTKCEEANLPPAFTPPNPDTSKAVKLFKPYLDDVNNDNNNIKEESQLFSPAISTPPCCSSVYPVSCETVYYNNNNLCDLKTDYVYTLHELQPNNYYYSYSPPLAYQSSDYEMSDCCRTYEDISYSQSVKRQSYSLDFKLSAIDCYYQDTVCRGNQRAVASKYNIHRRQVQKWLKQAEELRQRNESLKQINAVS